jgi:hypothetical protein
MMRARRAGSAETPVPEGSVFLLVPIFSPMSILDFHVAASANSVTDGTYYLQNSTYLGHVQPVRHFPAPHLATTHCKDVACIAACNPSYATRAATVIRWMC